MKSLESYAVAGQVAQRVQTLQERGVDRPKREASRSAGRALRGAF